MIPWRPIAELPDELKDGREVLLWTAPAYGCVESWVAHWSDAVGEWVNDEMVGLAGVTHFAEITPPNVPLWATEGESWELEPSQRVNFKDWPKPGDNWMVVDEVYRVRVSPDGPPFDASAKRGGTPVIRGK